MVENGNNLIAISTKDGMNYALNELDEENRYDMSGEYGDEAFVLISKDSSGVSGLAYFDTSTRAIHPINYEYTELIETPRCRNIETINSGLIEFGQMPAFNISAPAPTVLS